MTGTPNGDAPSIIAASYNFKAEIEVPKSGAEGMIVTHGGRFAGYGFYLLKGKLDKLTLTIDRTKHSPEDIEKLKMAMPNNPASD